MRSARPPVRLCCLLILFSCLFVYSSRDNYAVAQRRAVASVATPQPQARSIPFQFRLFGESHVFTRRVPVVGAPLESLGLFQSVRYGPDFTYVLENLPSNRNLHLELGFAELLAHQPGERAFLVQANGRVLYDNLDVVAAAGGPQRALVLRTELEPTARLELRFIGKRGVAIVNYVRVLGLGQEIILGPAAGRLLSPPATATYDLDRAQVAMTGDSVTPAHGMPIGGIGTGSFELLPDGGFSNFTIGNSWENPVTGLQGTFIVVRAKHRSFSGDARMLRVGKQASPYGNLKAMESSYYSARFPCAELELFDGSFPLEVRVQAVAPVVPYDLTLSSVPAALLFVEVSNPNTYPVASGVALSWEDFIGRGGSGEPGDVFGQASLLVHNDAGSAELMGVHLSSLEPQLGRRGSFLGDQFVGTVTTGVVVTRLLHWDPSTPTVPWLKDFIRSGRLTSRREHPEYWSTSQGRSGSSAAVVAVAFNLAPKESRRIPFVVAWYYPHFLERGATQSHTPSYVGRFASSVGAAFYLTSKLDELLIKINSWHSELADCDLPSWLRNSLLNSAARCVANSVWWRGESVRWWRSTNFGKGVWADDLNTLAPEAWFHRFFGELAAANPYCDQNGESVQGIGSTSETTRALCGNAASLIDVLGARALRLLKRLDEATTEPGKVSLSLNASGESLRALANAVVSRSDTFGTVFADLPTTITGDLRAYKLLWAVATAQALAALVEGSDPAADSAPYSDIAQQLKDQALRQLNYLETSWNSGETTGPSSFAPLFAADYAYREACGKGILDDGFRDLVRSLVVRHLPADNVVPLEYPPAQGAISCPLLLNPWLAAEAIELGYANAGFEIAARQARLAAHPQNNPWGPAYYVDVGSGLPVGGFNDVAAVGMWAILDAVVGVRYDPSRETLRVVPRLPFELGDHVFLPVFTPHFHGLLEFDSREGEWKLSIYRFRSERDGKALCFRHLITADPDYPDRFRELLLPDLIRMEAGQQLIYRAGHCYLEQ